MIFLAAAIVDLIVVFWFATAKRKILVMPKKIYRLFSLWGQAISHVAKYEHWTV
jgi:hypothetical protein